MTISAESICNTALLSLGQETISDLDDTSDPQSVKLKSIYSDRLAILLGYTNPTGIGWGFNRKRAELTRVYKLTLDSAPTPSADGWAVGDTITGVTSGVTSTIVIKVSNTEYWVTEPSDDYTDGEVLTDGTNTRDCAAGYPEIDETPIAFGSYMYAYQIPSDYLANLKLVDYYDDKLEYPYHQEGKLIFTNIDTAYAKYNYSLTDETALPLWFVNLFAMDLANCIAPKFVGNDQYVALRAKRNLAEAWMDALSGNGATSYFEGPGRDTDGNTDVYEGFRTTEEI